ncbi:hypothetical protein GEMRC1_002742 [Eukaryota sp. GEM-RC1]
MIPPLLLVVLFSISVSLVSELLGWLFVYRTSKYKNMKNKISTLLDKWEKGKYGDQKTLQKTEDTLRQENKNIQIMKAKGTFFLGIIMVVAYRLLSKRFDGVVVAKLPFEPFGLIKKISHRRLAGEDFTDCSMSFLYALCSASIRANLVKLLGFQPKKLPQELLMNAQQ